LLKAKGLGAALAGERSSEGVAGVDSAERFRLASIETTVTAATTTAISAAAAPTNTASTAASTIPTISVTATIIWLIGLLVDVSDRMVVVTVELLFFKQQRAPTEGKGAADVVTG
jgi:hypothetical protein